MANHVPPPVEYQPPSATLTPSLVRTLLPFLAGLIGTWLVEKFGVEVDTATIGALLTAGIGYGYYVVVRFLEVYGSDKWGYILGFRRLPVYASTPLPSTVVATGEDRPLGEEGRTSLGLIGLVLAVAGLVGLAVALLTDAHRGVTLFALLFATGVVLALWDGNQSRTR